MFRHSLRGRQGGAVFIRSFTVALTLGVTVLPALATDWPQWRGPARSGVSSETLSRWPASGPKRLWQAQLGEGYSSVAVAGNRVYTMGNAGNQDTVYCLNAGTGKVIWKYSYPCAAGDYGGPRATPTVDGTVVYTLSREGQAFSLNAGNGKLIWGKDLRRETGAEMPRWGFAGSPLVESGRVIYNVGASGVALDGRGQVAWKSGRAVSGYASPVSYSIGGQRGVAIFSGNALYGVNPQNGRVLWQFPWQTMYDVNAADPVVAGDSIFISSNYGKGCALVRIAGGRPSAVWQNRNMRNHTNGSVLVGGALFGNDENTLKCLDLGSGAERWRMRGGLGRGGLMAAKDKLLILTERGELILASATPNAYTELARASVGRGTWWTHPVLANGKIYCRSHEGTLVCLDADGK